MPLLPIAADVDALFQAALDRTAAEHRCAPAADSTDITVCGLRRADRFRVPIVVHDPGDPRYQSVRQEREALLHRTNAVQDKSYFLVNTGQAGVTATMGLGPNGGVTVRKPAP